MSEEARGGEPETDAWNGCFTGDCPHETGDECVKHLSGYVTEIEQENLRLRGSSPEPEAEGEPVAPLFHLHIARIGSSGGWMALQAFGSFSTDMEHAEATVYMGIVDLYTRPAEGDGAREALDHKAMEKLRGLCSAANRMGDREWDFNHLTSTLYLTVPNNVTYVDPADAILASQAPAGGWREGHETTESSGTGTAIESEAPAQEQNDG